MMPILGVLFALLLIAGIGALALTMRYLLLQIACAEIDRRNHEEAASVISAHREALRNTYSLDALLTRIQRDPAPKIEKLLEGPDLEPEYTRLRPGESDPRD